MTKKDELVENYGLTPGQIAWRRIKLEEMDFDIPLFEQEYPISIQDCFKPSGASLFQYVNLKKEKGWNYEGNHTHRLGLHPLPNYTYSVGVDPAGGVGGDNATIQVICVETGEQVYEYAHNFIQPDALGEKTAEIGEEFNWAFLTVESNNHGPVTLKALQDWKHGDETGYPEHLMYHMRTGGGEYGEDKTLMELGFRTTKRTKPIMIGVLRTALIPPKYDNEGKIIKFGDGITIHSETLSDELSTFIEHPNGELAAQENCMDDRVMGLALANMGLTRAALYATMNKLDEETKKQADVFSLEYIIKELHKRGQNCPVKPQHNRTTH